MFGNGNFAVYREMESLSHLGVCLPLRHMYDVTTPTYTPLPQVPSPTLPHTQVHGYTTVVRLRWRPS